MCFVKVAQPYVFGGMVGITSENTCAVCEGCGKFFKVNLYASARQDDGDDIRDTLVFPLCPECAAQWNDEEAER